MRFQTSLGYARAAAGDFRVREVLAHITPTFDASRRVISYHSNRRVPGRKQVDLFDGIYRQLLAEERRHSDWRVGMQAAGEMLHRMISAQGVDYEEFMFAA
jgi:hypothetical protein